MTIDLKTLGFIVIGIALLILIIYLILLVRKAIDTLKRADIVIDDCQDVTGVASTRVIQLDGAVDDLADSITGVTDAFKGGQEKGKSLGTVISAVGSIKDLLSKDNDTELKEERKREREAERETKREAKKKARQEARDKARAEKKKERQERREREKQARKEKKKAAKEGKEE